MLEAMIRAHTAHDIFELNGEVPETLVSGQTPNISPIAQHNKISTSLVECECVKAKIGKALRADGSPCVWKKFPPARGQKGFLS